MGATISAVSEVIVALPAFDARPTAAPSSAVSENAGAVTVSMLARRLAVSARPLADCTPAVRDRKNTGFAFDVVTLPLCQQRHRHRRRQ